MFVKHYHASDPVDFGKHLERLRLLAQQNDAHLYSITADSKIGSDEKDSIIPIPPMEQTIAVICIDVFNSETHILHNQIPSATYEGAFHALTDYTLSHERDVLPA